MLLAEGFIKDVLVSRITDIFKELITQLEAKFMILPDIDFYFSALGINWSFNLVIGSRINSFRTY